MRIKMKIDLKNLTIKKAHESLKKGDFTAVELTQAYLDEIAAKNKDIHAYLEVFEDALEAAKKAGADFLGGKDNITAVLEHAVELLKAWVPDATPAR